MFTHYFHRCLAIKKLYWFPPSFPALRSFRPTRDEPVFASRPTFLSIRFPQSKLPLTSVFLILLPSLFSSHVTPSLTFPHPAFSPVSSLLLFSPASAPLCLFLNRTLSLCLSLLLIYFITPPPPFPSVLHPGHELFLGGFSDTSAGDIHTHTCRETPWAPTGAACKQHHNHVSCASVSCSPSSPLTWVNVCLCVVRGALGDSSSNSLISIHCRVTVSWQNCCEHTGHVRYWRGNKKVYKKGKGPKRTFWGNYRNSKKIVHGENYKSTPANFTVTQYETNLSAV